MHPDKFSKHSQKSKVRTTNVVLFFFFSDLDREARTFIHVDSTTAARSALVFCNFGSFLRIKSEEKARRVGSALNKNETKAHHQVK